MEQQPGPPPVRTVGVPAATGDILVILLRRWHEVAAETLPGDDALTELLTTRLRDIATGPTPQEADLLAITEEAVQHAIGCGAADAARQLSKRLRRAIYEYLLSLDAMSAAEVAAPALGPFPGTPAFARSVRDGDRPELIWDEPELRVLEGGAKPPLPDADAGEAVSDPPPAIEAPEQAEHEGEQPGAEADEAHHVEATAALPEDHPEEAATGEDRPHLHVIDRVEAARVPEVFRRADLDIDADAPVNPFAPPKSTPQVVASYSAWADVLASEPEQLPEASALPAAAAPAAESRRVGALQARLAAARHEAAEPSADREGEAEATSSDEQVAERHDGEEQTGADAAAAAADTLEAVAEAAPVEQDEEAELEPAAVDGAEVEPDHTEEPQAATVAEPDVETVAEPDAEAEPAEDTEPEAEAKPVEDAEPEEEAEPEEAPAAEEQPEGDAEPDAAVPADTAAEAKPEVDGDWPWLPQPTEVVAEDWLEGATIEPWLPSGPVADEPAAEADAEAEAEHHDDEADADDAEDGDESGEPAWSVRRSPRQQALQKRIAERRREEVIRAAAEAFDGNAASRPRRHRLPELVAHRLPDQIDGLLRRKRAGEAAALVQRAAQEIAGREIADLALECGDRCRDRRQTRAAINSYLAAWRADPVYEAPLWRLADTCLADQEVELAVGYLERIADLMRARGDDEGAIEVYRKVVEVAPDRGDMRALLQTAESAGRFPD